MVTTSRHDRPRRDEHDIYHLTLLAEIDAGLPQPHQGVVARVPRRLLPEAPRRLRAARAAPRGARSAPPAASAARCSQAILQGRLPAARGSTSSASSRSSGATRSSSSCRTTASPEQLQVNPQLIRLARDMRAPLLATNDSHYTHRDDAEAHDALLCVQTGADARRPEALQVRRRRVLPEDRGRRCATSSPTTRRRATTRCSIAERADVEIEFGNAVLPDVPDAAGARRGLLPPRAHASRAPRSATGISPGPEVLERIEFELGVIKTMGFSAYFLVVWDLVRYARRAASASVRAGGARRARASRTASASSTSTRSGTTCCSSASSTRAASRCPTSTWTSTPATAAR